MSGIINSIVNVLGSILGFILSFLPNSPFRGFIESINLNKEFLGYLNFIVPVSLLVTIIEAWVLAIGVYYLYMQILRITRAIK